MAPVFPNYEIDRNISRLILLNVEGMFQKATGAYDLIMTSIDPINYGFVYFRNTPHFIRGNELFNMIIKKIPEMQKRAQHVCKEFNKWCDKINTVIRKTPTELTNNACQFYKNATTYNMVDDICPILLTYAKCNWNDIDSVHIRGINIEEYGIIFDIKVFRIDTSEYQMTQDYKYVTLETLIEFANDLFSPYLYNSIKQLTFNIAANDIKSWCDLRINILDEAGLITCRENIEDPVDSRTCIKANIELTEDKSLYKTNDIEGDDLAEAWRKGFAAHAYAMTDPSYKVVNPYIQRS